MITQDELWSESEKTSITETDALVTCQESDRIHHYFPRADSVIIDIYNDGEVIVLVRVGDKYYIQECGGGRPSKLDSNKN